MGTGWLAQAAYQADFSVPLNDYTPIHAVMQADELRFGTGVCKSLIFGTHTF